MRQRRPQILPRLQGNGTGSAQHTMTTAARIRRLTLTNFRSYHAAALAVGDGPAVLVGPNGAGKTNLLEAISFLAPGRGLAPRHARRGRLQRGRRLVGGVRRGRGRARPRHARAPASSRRRATTPRWRANAGIDREPVGLRRGLRRSPARRLAGAGDGRPVCRPGRRAAALSRPAGARGRRRARRARQRARARAALAQPAAGDPRARSALARRHRTRDRRARGRGRGGARRDGPPPRRRAGGEPRARRRISVRRDRARRLDGDAGAHPSGRRGRGSLSRGAPRQPRARCRAPAARSTGRISPTSRVVLRAEGHRGARRLDRRAEGAADRPRAGPCRAGRRR